MQTGIYYYCRYGIDVSTRKPLPDQGAHKKHGNCASAITLMIANLDYYTAAATFLIECQVDFHMQCKDGDYALRFAVMVGDRNTICYLLERQANKTVLHFAACRNGDQKLI